MFTMQELITEWFYDYERNLIKSSSAACYYAHIYNYIVPCLGEYAVEELSEFILQNYFMELYKNGRKKCEGGLSSKTVQDNYMILNNFFKYLKKRGIIKENICSDIRLPKDYNHNVRVLSREEQRAIEREVRKSTYENSFGIIICLYTGIRIGDADGKISLNQQKPSKHAGLRRFGPEKFLQRNNEFMKERPIFYKKPIKTEKDFSTWLRCFYYTTKAVVTEYIYF